MSDVELKFSVPAGVEVLQAPSKIPPVFNGEKLVLYGWLKGGAGKSGQGTAVLRGKTLGSDVEHSIDFQLGGESPSSDTPIVHQLAAKSLIQDWQSSEKEKSKRKAAIIKLSIESSVVSCHTSYVAVDEDQDKPIEGAIKTYDLTATSAPSYLRAGGLGLSYGGMNYCMAPSLPPRAMNCCCSAALPPPAPCCSRSAPLLKQPSTAVPVPPPPPSGPPSCLCSNKSYSLSPAVPKMKKAGGVATFLCRSC